MKRVAGWFRCFADWLHPDSQPPCVLRLDAERAYIDGVQYIAWRIAQEQKPRKPAVGSVSEMNESLTRVFHGPRKQMPPPPPAQEDCFYSKQATQRLRDLPWPDGTQRKSTKRTSKRKGATK